MKTFNVSIVTPNGKVVDDQFEMVTAKTVEGEIGIMAGHLPMVAPLVIGEVRLKNGNSTDLVAISGGFLEVGPEKATILAQTAETAESIDKSRAEAAKARAEERLNSKSADLDVNRAEVALKRAINRIKVSSK